MKCQADGKLKATWVRTAAARDCTAWSPESPTADTYTPITPPKPTSVTASCANGVLTVTWEPAGAGLAEATAYKPRIFTGASTIQDARWTADAAGHDTTTAAIPGPGEPDLPATGVFQVKVKASNAAGGSGWSDAAEAGCALNPVSELRAVCRDDGKLGITWKVAEWYRQSAASRQFAVEIDGAHVGDEAASGQPEQAYHWDGAVVNKQHKVRVGARTLGAHTPVQYPWTARVAADKCPRFVPQNATASCNGHGVVKVSWDAVEGAAKYKLDNLAYEGPGGADGDRRYAVAQRNEGQTYTFRAAAHTAGDWGGWSNTATTTCDPLDPAEPGHPDWRSPNGERESGCVQGVCVNRWVNPPLARYVLDAATAFGSGRDNCTPTVRNAANTGWTRTCTIYWTEHLDVEVDDDKVLEYFQHGKGRAHGADEPHLHKTADGRASVEAHRHCGDHTTDGTCSDESDIPDLPWHPPLPKPGDTWWDNALEENGASIIVGTTVGAAFGYVVASGGGTVGSTLGPVGTVVGAVLGFAVGMGIAWLNSRDDDVTLSISGFTECLAPPWLSATDAKWAKQTATVSETLEENGYTTIISNKIDHCVETVG